MCVLKGVWSINKSLGGSNVLRVLVFNNWYQSLNWLNDKRCQKNSWQHQEKSSFAVAESQQRQQVRFQYSKIATNCRGSNFKITAKIPPFTEAIATLTN
jgi:hypothetical protein